MGNYKNNRSFADTHNPAMIKLLAYLLAGESFVVSTPDDDMKKASDLTWLKAMEVGGKSIACRVREFGYWDQRSYKYEFTLRAEVPGGWKTEFEKIVKDGYGDYMIYAHSCWTRNDLKTNPGTVGKLLHHWFIDLQALRFAYANGLIKLGNMIPNGDGTWFYAFDVRKMPHSVVISGSDAELCGDKIAKTPKASSLITASKPAKGRNCSGLLFGSLPA